MKIFIYFTSLLSFIVVLIISKSYGQESGEKEIFQSAGYSSNADSLTAQEPASKYKKYKNLYHSWGYSVLSDFSVSPINIYPSGTDINSNGIASIKYSMGERMMSLSFITYTYQFRYNIHEFNSNTSLSLSTPLSAGFGPAFSNRNVGLVTINIPLFFELNIGTGSTNSSDQEYGIVVGGGIEYTKMPVIIFGDEPDVLDMNGQSVDSFTDWFQPVLELGFRFWNKNNKAKEINLKYGFGTSKAQLPADVDYSDGDFFLASRTIKLTLIYLINY